MQIVQNRRRFLAALSSAGAAGLVGAPRTLRAEPPPETTTVRLGQFIPAGCDTPVYVAAELLRAEGFTDVRYVTGAGDPSEWLARGESDFDWNFPPLHIALIEAGAPLTVLAGMHSGCLELIANDSVRSITDLRGKKVGVYALTSSPHILLTLMTAYVGLDPVNDIQWVTSGDATSMDLFVDGKIDAFLAFPPEPQELRARKIGHTILNSTLDRPWSQYFCCLLTASTHYATTYPVATKRVLRAHLKAIDLCVSDPNMVAQGLVDDGFMRQYDRALETLTEVRYDRWREFDPEDTIRFYALRMHEAGMIKSGPQKIIADGTDWSFLNELKREMKT